MCVSAKMATSEGLPVFEKLHFQEVHILVLFIKCTQLNVTYLNKILLNGLKKLSVYLALKTLKESEAATSTLPPGKFLSSAEHARDRCDREEKLFIATEQLPSGEEPCSRAFPCSVCGRICVSKIGVDSHIRLNIC